MTIKISSPQKRAFISLKIDLCVTIARPNSVKPAAKHRIIKDILVNNLINMIELRNADTARSQFVWTTTVSKNSKTHAKSYFHVVISALDSKMKWNVQTVCSAPRSFIRKYLFYR